MNLKKISEILPSGLEGKLIRLVIILVFSVGIAFFIISNIQVAYLSDVVLEESEKEIDLVQDELLVAMSDITENSLLQLSIWAADKIDDEFWILVHDMRGLRSQVEDVFINPEDYECRKIMEPSPENAGKYVIQILFPDDNARSDEKCLDMAGRLSNLAPIMEEIVRGNEDFTLDCYIATVDGISIVMDPYSDAKFDEDGTIREYDPRERLWFKGAVSTEDVFFTPAVKSAFYDFDEIAVGMPVYVDNKLVAVIETSASLGDIEQKMIERKVGSDGFSIFVGKDGQLICSTRDKGELKTPDRFDSDIRKSVNRSLVKLINRALLGESGIEKVLVDDEYYYAAFAPVDTVEGTQIVFINEEEILSPAKELMSDMDDANNAMLIELRNHFSRSLVIVISILLVIMALAIISAGRIARKRVRPIKKMTGVVRGFVGDEMAFDMEDVYRTGDEVEELARAFSTMSVMMKQYVKEIVDNAAEKERLQTEMEAARDIQMKMLPAIKPDFFEKPGYELFARAVPAKAVGGDLYDFFYIDEDNLAFMVGDVSGKGITAALFMALCKNMIKFQMLMHGGDVVSAMTEANLRLVEEAAGGMFVTVWIGIVTLSTGKLRFVDGGHMYAAIKRTDGDFVIEEDQHSIFVGALSGAKFMGNELELRKGDTIYLYTDGVTEAHDENEEMFGEERLLKVLNENQDLSAEELDGHVRSKVAEFVGDTEQYDDITTLCFRYLGL